MTTPSNEPDQTGDPEESSPSPSSVGSISDEQLPEDLRPTDDNPLAKNPDENGDEAPGLTPDIGGGVGTSVADTPSGP